MRIAPSILNADFLHLSRALRAVERGGGDQIHVDVMDGHFVPNLSMGPDVVRSLGGGTRLPLDVHLMVDRPAGFIDPFLRAGSDGLTIHVEAGGSVRSMLRKIRSRGARGGVSIRPRTPVGALRGILAEVDLVLLMTVEPGFGGQPFQRGSLPRIRALRRMADRLNPGLDIEVDGGIGQGNVGAVVRAGANVIVVGWSVFGNPNPARALKRIRKRAEAAARRS